MFRDHNQPSSFELWRERFDELPVLAEGHSRIVRLVDEETVIVRLKPTLFSVAANKPEFVIGTDRIRLRTSEVLWRLLASNGISVPILAVGEDYYVSRRVTAPPIEVVVKAAHVGTPKHIYRGMETITTRDGGRVLPNQLHQPYVRFDWRNPLPDRDECMPVRLADRFIDTMAAQQTTLMAFDILSKFLIARGIILLDICFFVSADGCEIYGEVSPDCLRFEYVSQTTENGLVSSKTQEFVLHRWSKFLLLLETPSTAAGVLR